MILKFTFNDNDFTQIIEKFFEEGGFFNGNNFNTISNFVSFKHNITKYSEIVNIEDKNKLGKEIIDTIIKSFEIYIVNINPNSNWNTVGFTAKDLAESKPYILDNLKVSIVNEISDKWQNGEVIYYFTSNNKYLTM